MTEVFLTHAFLSLKSKISSGRSRFGLTEDVLVEAFCKLWKGHYKIESDKDAEALLSRTGRNLSIDEYRKSKRNPVQIADLSRTEILTDDSPGEREELFKKVETLIDSDLTDLQKIIVRKFEYEGLSLKRIALELGMQPAAVRMQISRARNVIRTKFREYE